jgi:hypothetical protein
VRASWERIIASGQSALFETPLKCADEPFERANCLQKPLLGGIAPPTQCPLVTRRSEQEEKKRFFFVEWTVLIALESSWK